MPDYIAGNTVFIREKGIKYEPGDIVKDLDEKVADYYITCNHASLKPVRNTAQGHPSAIRSPEKKEEKPAVKEEAKEPEKKPDDEKEAEPTKEATKGPEKKEEKPKAKTAKSDAQTK